MRGTIRAVQAYELHGTLYYQFIYTVDGNEQPRQTRISHDMAYPQPQAGDRVEINAILGIVDRITKVEE